MREGRQMQTIPYSQYIQQLRDQWIGKKVMYRGWIHTVVNVDYNAMLLIDLKSRFNDTTAVATYDVQEIAE